MLFFCVCLVSPDWHAWQELEVSGNVTVPVYFLGYGSILHGDEFPQPCGRHLHFQFSVLGFIWFNEFVDVN
jgi:hypothetical protein